VSYEPIPAAGPGADLFDQPALFYLTNQKLIQEWAGLADGMSASVKLWLEQVVQPVLGQELLMRGLTAELGSAGSYYGLLGRFGAPAAARRAACAVGLFWTSKPDPSANSIFSGTYFAPTDAGLAGAQAFRAAAEAIPIDDREPLRSGNTWVMWRWVSAPAQWWTNLNGYCAHLVNDTVSFIDAIVEPLKSAHDAAARYARVD
jgi:hypothetical protein